MSHNSYKYIGNCSCNSESEYLLSFQWKNYILRGYEADTIVLRIEKYFYDWKLLMQFSEYFISS